MTNVSFWINDINILLNKDYICEIFPTENMTFESKLNAISRLVIILSILGFLITHKNTFLIIGGITLMVIFMLYKNNKKKIIDDLIIREGFSKNNQIHPNKNSSNDANNITLESVLKNDFYQTSKKNPMGNVLLNEISDTPDRKSAAPAFNPEVNNDINSAVKKQTQYLNPTIVNTNKQLYGDLKDNYDLDISMRNFYSTANTRVANDQGAFSKFLYGNMPSGKSSGPDGALARMKNSQRYLLI